MPIGRGLTLPTSTVRLEMFSSIQSTIDSLVYRWWQRDFWTEHFFAIGLGPTDYGVARAIALRAEFRRFAIAPLAGSAQLFRLAITQARD